MEAYFTVESISRKPEVTFQTLRTRLVAVVHARMQNGEFTERGLAKILGISQPQIHNVLKGARKLQWELAERLMAELHIKLLDLWTEEELGAEERVRGISGQAAGAPYWARGEQERATVARRQPGREMRIGEAEFRTSSAAV